MPSLTAISKEVRVALHVGRFRFRVANFFCSLLPQFSFTTVRTAIYRGFGIQAGERVAFMHSITVSGSGQGIFRRLTIGDDSTIGTGVLFDLDDAITIGSRVMIGPGVRIYTSKHALGPSSQRFTPSFVTQPVSIEDGAWVGLGSIILAGVTIGHGSVVGAGSVVNRDVPPDTLVSGVPAVVVKELPKD